MIKYPPQFDIFYTITSIYIDSLGLSDERTEVLE